MTHSSTSDSSFTPNSHLDAISTRWAQIGDPLQFVMRYAPAIRKYLTAILENSADADDVCQDFLLRYLSHHFETASPDQGKFRKYLKSAVRNAALMHLRSQRQHLVQQLPILELEDDSQLLTSEESDWTASWRQCLLDRAWQALHGSLRKVDEGNLLYTALRMSADHPDEDSGQLATRVSEKLGRPIKPDALRKQLSRARRQFAELIIREISQSLENKSADNIEQELIEIGLLTYVRKMLPSDWRELIASQVR